MIEVFNIFPGFSTWSIPFMPIALALLVVFFLLYMIIAALKTFEGLNLERKLIHFVSAAVMITLWPALLLNIKGLIDSFNTFLIENVFRMNWSTGMGKSFHEQLLAALSLDMNILHYPLKILNVILALGVEASYQVIYWLFVIFFFLYAALGPLVIARSVFGEEFEGVIELIKEMVTLFLWQSTYVVVVGILGTGYASTNQFFNSDQNIFLSASQAVALIVLTLFVPMITRKFVGEISAGFFTATPGGGLGAVALGALVAHRPRLLAPALTGAGFKKGVLGTMSKKLIERSQFEEDDRRQKRADSRSRMAPSELLGGGEARLPAPEPLRDLNQERLIPEREPAEEFREKRAPSVEVEAKILEKEVQPWLEDREHDRASVEVPKIEEPPQRRKIKFLELIFKKDPSGRFEQKAKVLRRKALLIRGPVGCDKYLDIENFGISHLAYESQDLSVLRRYLKSLEQFQRRFAWLYDMEGRFSGPENSRPKKEDTL
jgi:hypothetical protein